MEDGELLFRIRPSEQMSFRMRTHQHQMYQLHYVTRGELRHQTDGKFVKLTRGDCCIDPPQMPHRIRFDPQVSSFYSIMFFEQFLPDELREQAQIRSFLDGLQKPGSVGRLVLSTQEMLHMDELTAYACEEYEGGDPGRETLLQGVLTAMLVILSRAYAREQQESKYNAAFSETLDYIQANYSDHLIGAMLAKRMYLSESTFYRIFKRLTGHSFKEYLTAVRIRSACICLRDKELPLSTIAVKCGYSDYSAFYRAFLHQLGMTPLAYRQSYQPEAEPQTAVWE